MSVEIFTYGDELEFRATIRDAGNALVDPDTLSFRFLSNGIESEVTKTKDDDPSVVTQVSTGVWKLVHTFDTTYQGKMVYGRVETTTPATAHEFEFRVGESKFD